MPALDALLSCLPVVSACLTRAPRYRSPGNKHVGLNIERIKYWLSVGAQPSTTVGRLLSQAGVIPRGIPTPLGFQTVKNPEKWARKEAAAPAEDTTVE